MIRHSILLFLVAMLTFACAQQWRQQPGGTAASDPPNVLVINIDDLGFHDLSCNGSKIYETPNVDRFSRESYSFHTAYANYPRCLPSRFALMSATYPVLEFNGDLSSAAGPDNFIRQFKKAGYDSYYVGKWHLGEGENSPAGFGFDDSFAANGAGGVASHFYPYNTKKLVAPIGDVPPIKDAEEEGREGDYLTDALTQKMIDFVRAHDRSKPFFAMLCTYAVHTPFEAKEADIARNRAQIGRFEYGNTPEYVKEGNGVTKMRQDNAVYAAMVENMDWNVGRLLDALAQAGLAKNTIVVFTSDHGGLSNRGSTERELATTNYPLRAGKGHLYEGGIRVPLMIRWPDGIKARTDKESIVLLMDLMPSLLDLAIDGGLKMADGNSFEKVIAGREKWNDRRVFFHEKMARPNMTGDFPCTAMRAGNYKLLHYLATDTYELYDLSSDPGEKNDLIRQKTEIAAELKAELATWKQQHVVMQN